MPSRPTSGPDRGAADPTPERPVPLLAIFAVLFLCIFAAGGCAAKIPLAEASLDADAKTFRTNPGQGNLYVVRDRGYFGSATMCRISLDDRMKGGLGPGTFHFFQVAPGSYIVSVFSNENQASLPVEIGVGESQFVEVKPEGGWAWVAERFSLTQRARPPTAKRSWWWSSAARTSM
jgi:hypothetical protein